MSDDRKTSYSKDVELTSYQKTALDRVETIRARYDAAAKSAETDQEVQRSDDSATRADSGSRQVKETAMEPHLRPSGDIRNQQDRITHQDKMAADDAAAKDANSEELSAKFDRAARAKDAMDARNSVQSKDGNEKD